MILFLKIKKWLILLVKKQMLPNISKESIEDLQKMSKHYAKIADAYSIAYTIKRLESEGRHQTADLYKDMYTRLTKETNNATPNG